MRKLGPSNGRSNFCTGNVEKIAKFPFVTLSEAKGLTRMFAICLE